MEQSKWTKQEDYSYKCFLYLRGLLGIARESQERGQCESNMEEKWIGESGQRDLGEGLGRKEGGETVSGL